MGGRSAFKRAACACALAAAGLLCAGVLTTGAVPSAQAATNAAPRVTWKMKAQRSYCYMDGKKLTGLRTVGKRVYLFNKKGVQLTGWQKVDGVYRFFTVKSGAKGSMAKGRVVNGVKLLKDGVAVGGKDAGKELRLMARATKIAQAQTRAGWSEVRKLKAVWRWMQKNKTFRSGHAWVYRVGRHRLYANDILFGTGGDCDSWAAGFAYLANAVGAKRCSIIASGGHGWAEVNGKVYDLQMSGYHSYRYFAYPYTGGWIGGAPDYRHNRVYIVKLSPLTKRWSHEKDKTVASKKRGLVVTKSATRFYDAKGKMLKSSWKTVDGRRYWFKSSGKAATGPAKVRGKRYVFTAEGWLGTGKRAHIVTVNGKRYRASKTGRALAGWYSAKKRYAYENGELATGLRLIGSKIWRFSESGIVNREKSRAIQDAFVVDADPAGLIELMGEPDSVKRASSCFWQTAADGTQQAGEDVTYCYPHLKVYCFEVTEAGAPDEGKLFLKSAYV